MTCSRKSAVLVMSIGAVAALMGAAGLIVPAFTTRQTTDIAQIGSLKIQTQEDATHVVSPETAGAVLAFGIVLMIGGALYGRRSTGTSG